MHATTIAPSYPVRLKEFSLMPFETRLMISDLLRLLCIIRGFVFLSNSKIKFSQLRPYRMNLSRVNTTRCKNYFLHRTLLLWNKITRNSSCLTMLFEQFRKLIASINLIPHIHGSALKANLGCVRRYLIDQSINQ